MKSLVIVVVLSASSLAGYDYTVTSGFAGSFVLEQQEQFLMTGGGVTSIEAWDYSFVSVQGTAPLAPGSGGVGTLDLLDNSCLALSGGEVGNFTIHESAMAVLSGGRIDALRSYQTVFAPDMGPHIEMIVKDYSFDEGSNRLTGTWVNDSLFNIQLYNQAGYDAAIDNIYFTVIPEPTTLMLLGVGGLAVVRKRRT